MYTVIIVCLHILLFLLFLIALLHTNVLDAEGQ